MPSAWIEHVKKYASENGVSYRQAMKDSKATYVSQAKPKAPPKPRAPPKPKEPKGPPKPRGRPRKLTEREIQMSEGDTGVQLFEEAKSRMKEKDLRKLEKKRKPPKRKVKVIKYDEEEEWDENAPMNFTAVEKQEEMAPAFETPFKQPPTLFIPDPYKIRISRHKYPLLEREIKSNINKRKQQLNVIKTFSEEVASKANKKELNKKINKKLLKLLEDPVKKAKEEAIRLSEIESMANAEKIQQDERAYIRKKEKPTLDLIAEKEKNRLARYKDEADKILKRQLREKEIERIYASYGVKSKPKHLQGLDDILEKFKQPASRNDWWPGKP